MPPISKVLLMFKFCAALAVPLSLLVASPAATAGEPASPSPANEAPDPVHLSLARRTVDYVFPVGTYARIMSGAMDRIMDSALDSVTHMPLKSLAGLGGANAAKLGSGTLAEIVEIYDPAYKQRMPIMTRAIMTDMIGLMTQLEPEIRDGLARAYASKFDEKQLGELNAFFATPTGKAYAADSYVIMTSPEVTAKMQAFMPKMMQQMPAIIEKAKTATASLPAPRRYSDLTEAEKDKLAGLLGLSRADLDKKQAAKAAPRN